MAKEPKVMSDEELAVGLRFPEGSGPNQEAKAEQIRRQLEEQRLAIEVQRNAVDTAEKAADAAARSAKAAE